MRLFERLCCIYEVYLIQILTQDYFNDTTEAALTYRDVLRHILYHFYFHSSDHIHCMEFHELIQLYSHVSTADKSHIYFLLLLYMEYFVPGLEMFYSSTIKVQTHKLGCVVLTFYTNISTLVLQIKTSIKLIQGL